MAKVAVYNLEGKEINHMDLPKEMWEVPMKEKVVHDVVKAQRANARVAIAHTKTKGEVRGGGRKPWKQKHTGNARQGSIRSPQWRGGGIVFGPRSNRNFSIQLNKKVKKKALFMVLSDKYTDQKLIVVEGMSKDMVKTKQVVEMLKKLPGKAVSISVIVPKEMKNLVRALGNVKKIQTLPATSLNVYDLLKKQWLIVPKEGLEEMHKTYLKA